MISVKESSFQPLIHSAAFDISLMIGPPLASGLMVFFLNRHFSGVTAVGPLLWFLLVVGIDVAHVYGSLFRTYLDPQLHDRGLLWAVPAACWFLGTLLFSLSPAFFWTALAYVAVFHFVRQQYGFAMIYSRRERGLPGFFRTLDKVTIFAVTLYPLLFWHTHLPRNFTWLINNDFIAVQSAVIGLIGQALYFLVLAAYVGKEVWILKCHGRFNTPKNLLVLGTAVSWYVGIVWLNDDLAFTLTNVVSHGIPYIALVWMYGRKNPKTSVRIAGRSLFELRLIPVYLAVLLILAYLEEGFWDGFIWKDHTPFFPTFSSLPLLQDPLLLALVVPFLALPQSTHYVFDAFLWRSTGQGSRWKEILLAPEVTK